MAGRGNTPDGTPEPPEGVPGGNDDHRDDYRSVVFDESFVRAARIQEFSARERLADERHAAVRSRPAAPPGDAGRFARGGIAASRQGIVLVLLIVVAFGTAIYMGIRNPYQTPASPPVDPMRSALLPLAPRAAVPGATPADLYEHSPAADFRTGATGVTLPPIRRTAHFSEGQVLAALSVAKDYVVESSLNPKVLAGGAVREVRVLVDPAQHRQFDDSLDKPRNDGRHAATAWMVRIDPARAVLADPRVRVDGTLRVREAGGDALEVMADHVFVYALRAAGTRSGATDADRPASLFTVRREIRFHVTREDLRAQQVSVAHVEMHAGPMPCSVDPSDMLRPLLAGEVAKDDGPAGTDPYARGRSTAPACGVLSTSSQPRPAHPATSG